MRGERYTERMNVRIRGLIAALVALIVLLIVISAIAQFGGGVPTAPASSAPQVKSPPPPPTTAESSQAAQTFQSLVSYTDRGFEPTSATVQAGDTVRFTNNSSRQLWVAASGTDGSLVYPGNSSCGGSAFDSCVILQPGEFWNFTFTQGGTWGYQNNLNKTDEGNIIVETTHA